MSGLINGVQAILAQVLCVSYVIPSAWPATACAYNTLDCNVRKKFSKSLAELLVQRFDDLERLVARISHAIL